MPNIPRLISFGVCLVQPVRMQAKNSWHGLTIKTWTFPCSLAPSLGPYCSCPLTQIFTHSPLQNSLRHFHDFDTKQYDAHKHQYRKNTLLPKTHKIAFGREGVTGSRYQHLAVVIKEEAYAGDPSKGVNFRGINARDRWILPRVTRPTLYVSKKYRMIVS